MKLKLNSNSSTINLILITLIINYSQKLFLISGSQSEKLHIFVPVRLYKYVQCFNLIYFKCKVIDFQNEKSKTFEYINFLSLGKSTRLNSLER